MLHMKPRIVVALSVLALTGACKNDDVADWEPGNAGETGGAMAPEGCWEPDGAALTTPTSFQCVGEGVGELNFLKCEDFIDGCTGSIAGVCDFENVDDWTVDSAQAGPYSFPPTPPP